MTKYILNSGGNKNNLESKKKFHNELVKGLGQHPKILLCNFAQGREYWEIKYKDYCESISEDVDCAPVYDLAMPESFAAQVAQSEAIYFHGGDDHLVQYWLSKYNLTELFTDKVIATNSASSDALASSFWTCDWRQVKDGLAVLPIKFIPHYKSDWNDKDPRGKINWAAAYKELKSYGNKDLPIYAMLEGEYLVYENSKVKVIKSHEA
jgi:hypothetical protein